MFQKPNRSSGFQDQLFAYMQIGIQAIRHTRIDKAIVVSNDRRLDKFSENNNNLQT